MGRFRDIAISSDGTKIYVSADSVGAIKDAPGISGVPPNKGCILEFTFKTKGISGSAQNQNIGVYPNPASGSFNLLLPSRVIAAELNISNILGQTCLFMPVTANKTTINTLSLVPGVYTIRVKSAQGSWSSRLVID